MSLLEAANESYNASLEAYKYGVKNLIDVVTAERQLAQAFTLIDTRTWYVIANYRESKLKNIQPGEHVEVFLMGRPDRRFNGTVESIGYGVFPEDGAVAQGLPNIDRT